MLARAVVFAVAIAPLVLVSWDSDAGQENVGALTETLEAIKQSFSGQPPQWCSSWQQEYVDTIAQVLGEHHSKPNFQTHSDELVKAFAVFWAGMDKASCGRAQFDCYLAQMRWFVEAFMSRRLPSRQEKDAVKRQFRELCDHARRVLKGEFPFLADAPMEAAYRASLQEYDALIETPLIPLFTKPFTADQVKRIRENWAGSYKWRCFLWRDIRDGSIGMELKGSPSASKTDPQYQFVKRCLDSLPGAVWPTIEAPPDDVIEALALLNKEKEHEKRQRQAVRAHERQLESRYSRRLEKVEQWSFIFAALLETSWCAGKSGMLDPNSRPASDNRPLGEYRGGGAYDLGN